MRFLVCLLAVLPIVVLGGVVEFCSYDLGKVHKAQLQMSDAEVIGRKDGTRSRVECATECYADPDCKTAVYKANGDCLFISNFTDTLTYYDHSYSYAVSEEVLEMRAKTRGLSQIALDCPSACTGYSVCFMDCTDGDELENPDAEAMCMDISTRQYDEDGCGFRPSIQTTEYYFPNMDVSTSSHDYEVFSVYFNKKFEWTTLQVKFRGTLRTAYGHTTGTWGKWRILFDNNDCGTPGYIESINYNTESDTDHYKASGIIGICNGITAGSRKISFKTYREVGTEFRVGFATHATRFYVEEIGQPTWSGEPAQKPCPSLPSFNFREHVTTTSWGNQPTVYLWHTYYTKMETDTWLRINLDVTLRMHTQGVNDNNCATWYVMIDEAHCAPNAYGKTIANLGNAHEVNNEHRSTELEGHCRGIAAGYRKISMYLANCPHHYHPRDTYTGWNSCRNRLVIEEYRPETNIAAVMDIDGQTLYRVPQLNMVTHGFYHITKSDDNNVVWTLDNYNKIYETSKLRLAISYDARVYWGHGNSGSYDPCCRHYFKINGAECADPGTIEGVNYLNKGTNLHRPNIMEGTCDNIPAGTVQLSVWSGLCKGYSKQGECHFGWNSYGHLMVSEAFIDREVVNSPFRMSL